LLAPLEVTLDSSWGLDHGTWSVLRHVYPDADIPVVQLSIDENKPASFHFEIGKKLAPLREEGILVLGSGNLVHNLHAYAWGRHMPEPYDWAVRFERDAKEMMVAGEYKPLIEYEKLGPEALLSIPTPDHYLPMLYVIATKQQGGEQRDRAIAEYTRAVELDPDVFRKPLAFHSGFLQIELARDELRAGHRLLELGMSTDSNQLIANRIPTLTIVSRQTGRHIKE